MGWIDIAPLPRGQQGDTGATGATGATGETGNPGDRYVVLAAQQGNSYALYRVLQVWQNGQYEAQGEPELLTSWVIPVGGGGSGEGSYIAFMSMTTEYVPGSAPYAIRFIGQYWIYNPVTMAYEEYGDPFITGQPLYAPQGLPGTPGTPGTPGEGTTIVYQVPPSLPAPYQIDVWGYVARMVAEIYGEIGSYEGEASWLTLVLNSLYRAASAFFPVEHIYGDLNLLTPGIRAALSSATAVDGASEILYCKFVTNPQLTSLQLNLISEQLGNPADYDNNPAFIAEILAAYIMNVVKREPGNFRSVVSHLKMQAALQETLPDYSYLPCTPIVPEDWQHIVDFTIDNQGWQSGIVGSPSASAVYETGVGWKSATQFDEMAVRYAFGQTVLITQVEVAFSGGDGTVYNANSGGITGEPALTLAAFDNQDLLPFPVVEWGGERFTGGLSVNYFDFAGTSRLVRVQIAGRGVNPFL